MDRLSELKIELHQAIEAEISEGHLLEIKNHLEYLAQPIPMVSETQEARLAIAFGQIERGR